MHDIILFYLQHLFFIIQNHIALTVKWLELKLSVLEPDCYQLPVIYMHCAVHYHYSYLITFCHTVCSSYAKAIVLKNLSITVATNMFSPGIIFKNH